MDDKGSLSIKAIWRTPDNVDLLEETTSLFSGKMEVPEVLIESQL